MGLSYDFPHHVWCMNNGDSEEHLSGQCENGHLMLYGVRGEGEDGAEVRCMGCGSQHKMSFGAFGGKKAAGEASGDGKASRGTIGVVFSSTGVEEIGHLLVRVEEEMKVVPTERWIFGSGGG